MAKRAARDFETNMVQQMKHIKPERVDPFPLMMDAARHQQHLAAALAGQLSGACAAAHGAAVQAGHGAAVFTMCSHCSMGLSEMQAQQCHTCKAVYCSSCSVTNYDQRETRVFCLECHQLDGMMEAEEGGLGSGGSLEATPYAAYLCSPPSGRGGGSGLSGAGGSFRAGACPLSVERRGSVQRACNRAAAAAAAADGGSAGCVAAMESMGGLLQPGQCGGAGSQQPQQQTPFLCSLGGGGWAGAAAGTAARFGCGGGGGSGSVHGRSGGPGSAAAAARIPNVLGEWDLNSASPLGRFGIAQLPQQQQLSTPAVLPFTAGY